jgi:molybdopterin molybdotransferase
MSVSRCKPASRLPRWWSSSHEDRRSRKLTEEFLELVSLPEAVSSLIEALPARIHAAKEIDTSAAIGRVLAGDVTASEDMPGFTRSQMDGYAVRAADTFGASEGLPAYLELAGEVPMGTAPDIQVEAGGAARISTGGVLPCGADAVVMVENTELSGSTVEVVKAVAPGENTVAADEDITRGSRLFASGRVLGPAELGALAGLGISHVLVFDLPVVGIISTGDELVAVEASPGPGQVRDLNSTALAAAVTAAGCVPRPYGIVGDDLESLLAAARMALEECDALLVSGGSSAGVRDITLEVLDALGEPGVLIHGIYLKPGKPTLVAVCDGKPALGLPGNPASALAVFRELAAPLLAHLRGEELAPWRSAPCTVEAVMERSVASATGRLELVPVSMRVEGDTLVASPVLGKSSLIGTLVRADGQVRIGEGAEGVEKGERVIVELI